MESQRIQQNVICEIQFSSTSTRNRHIQKFHPESTGQEQNKHIICPMCTNIEKFSFRNFEEFTSWRAQENREVNYACQTRNKFKNGEEGIVYHCNRSDINGFSSSCKVRNMKTGGSIRIQGTCPSRILVKVSTNGSVQVKFLETHVGHADELRTKRLSKAEENIVVGQLAAGVTNNRIIQDARKIQNNTIERINLITRGDLAYLLRKYNIDKKKGLKIEEWNRQGKNHAFLFKKIGESYLRLKDEDFAVGFMNSVMEKKLRDLKRIICIDGTHGTNRRNLDLT